PVQIQLSGRRAVAAAARRVARHIEPGIAGILSVEDTGARTHNPFGARVPGDPEARRKIFLVVSNQPLAEAAITRDLDRGIEPDQQTVIEVPSALPYEGWMMAHIGNLRRLVNERNFHVDQVPGLIQKRRRVLVAQAV